MSRIYIATKDVTFGFDSGYDHLYIVYDPDRNPYNKNELVIRGGAGKSTPDIAGSTWTFNAIEFQIGMELSASKDKGGTPESRYYRSLDVYDNQ
jgi:hypothetical protein